MTPRSLLRSSVCAECVEEYTVLTATSEDICPKCVGKARGADKKRFAEGVQFKLGVPVAAGKRKEPPAVAKPSKAKQGKS